jgi:hypothetical protein
MYLAGLFHQQPHADGADHFHRLCGGRRHRDDREHCPLRGEGEPPLQAALKGAKQIGFTIISLTISLIAVLIPLLFMGDVVGRLFHEFAITMAVAILMSAWCRSRSRPCCARACSLWLILAAHRHRLHRARRALRELRPPADHPVDAALGRGRRAAGADAVTGSDLDVIAIIGIILLIGIVKKNAIMMIDFAIDAERDAGLRRARRSTRLPAALPADPDDHAGGAARRAAADARLHAAWARSCAGRSASRSSAG